MVKPLTLLIVDDDEDDKEMFCEVVSEISNSHTCLTTANGQEALHLLQTSETLPNFIFLDLNMPRMSGKQCLTQLKHSERLSKIPVIIYTTSKLDADKEETMQLGADYFLTKPTSMQQLKEELKSVFDKKYNKQVS